MGKFVVSRAGEAYDARVRGPNRKFRSDTLITLLRGIFQICADGARLGVRRMISGKLPKLLAIDDEALNLDFIIQMILQEDGPTL